MSNEAFWKWFSTESAALRAMEPELLAERLAEALRSHVGDLGVEVAEEEEEEAAAKLQEVVFTADGDAARFDAVKALVAAAPALDGWSFVALKPPMGFDFTLEADGVELDGSALRFEPLVGPGGLGLRLYLPEAVAKEDDVEQLIRLLLQTGVGEENAAGIVHVEAAPSPPPRPRRPSPSPSWPITWSSSASRPESSSASSGANPAAPPPVRRSGPHLAQDLQQSRRPPSRAGASLGIRQRRALDVLDPQEIAHPQAQLPAAHARHRVLGAERQRGVEAVQRGVPAPQLLVEGSQRRVRAVIPRVAGHQALEEDPRLLQPTGLREARPALGDLPGLLRRQSGELRQGSLPERQVHRRLYVAASCLHGSPPSSVGFSRCIRRPQARPRLLIAVRDHGVEGQDRLLISSNIALRRSMSSWSRSCRNCWLVS